MFIHHRRDPSWGAGPAFLFHFNTRGCPVLVTASFAVTELALSLAEGAGNLTLNHNLRHDHHPLPLSRGPLRLDFYHPFRPGKIVTKAAPRPMLRFLHEFSFHGIAMDVAQLLNAFGLA